VLWIITFESLEHLSIVDILSPIDGMFLKTIVFSLEGYPFILVKGKVFISERFRPKNNLFMVEMSIKGYSVFI